MTRPKGIPNKATTLFRERLDGLKFSIPDEAVKLFFETDDDKIKARLLELMASYTFPKPTPVPNEDDPEQVNKVPLMAVGSDVLIEALRITQDRKGST